MTELFDKLNAKNAETHKQRFCTAIGTDVYGVQARRVLANGPKTGETRVQKADAIELVLVPVEQASGFDKISAMLRRVGRSGKAELHVFEEEFSKLKLTHDVAGTQENKNGETVDIYRLKSATSPAYPKTKGFRFVTAADLKDIAKEDKHINEVVWTFTKAEMSESVAANAEAMKANAETMKAKAAAEKA